MSPALTFRKKERILTGMDDELRRSRERSRSQLIRQRIVNQLIDAGSLWGMQRTELVKSVWQGDYRRGAAELDQLTRERVVERNSIDGRYRIYRVNGRYTVDGWNGPPEAELDKRARKRARERAWEQKYRERTRELAAMLAAMTPEERAAWWKQAVDPQPTPEPEPEVPTMYAGDGAGFWEPEPEPAGFWA